MDWEEGFLCITDETLHPRIRAGYAKFLLRAYVDVDPMVPDMETIDLNFVLYSSLTVPTYVHAGMAAPDP